MADALGISQSAYADYETGRSEPSIRMFSELANVLDTKAVWLAYGYGEPEGQENHLLLHTPSLMNRRMQDKLFLSVSSAVMEVLKQQSFFEDDSSLIVVITEKVVERIRKEYAATDEAVEMGIYNAEFHLRETIRNAKEEVRIKLLTDPTIYLPSPRGQRYAKS